MIVKFSYGDEANPNTMILPIMPGLCTTVDSAMKFSKVNQPADQPTDQPSANIGTSANPLAINLCGFHQAGAYICLSILRGDIGFLPAMDNWIGAMIVAQYLGMTDIKQLTSAPTGPSFDNNVLITTALQYRIPEMIHMAVKTIEAQKPASREQYPKIIDELSFEEIRWVVFAAKSGTYYRGEIVACRAFTNAFAIQAMMLSPDEEMFLQIQLEYCSNSTLQTLLTADLPAMTKHAIEAIIACRYE